MELYAGQSRIEIATARTLSPGAHGSSWVVTQKPKQFLTAYFDFLKTHPLTSPLDYFVLQLNGNIPPGFNDFYAKLTRIQSELNSNDSTFNVQEPDISTLDGKNAFIQRIKKLFMKYFGKLTLERTFHRQTR